MNKTYAAQFSVINPNELTNSLLSLYPLSHIKCRFYTQGVNDIYIVTCLEGTFYLKISLHNYITKEEIEAEVEAVCRLVKQGVSVAAPLCDHNGVYVQEIIASEGIRYAVLWHEAKGEIKGIKSKDENRNLGNLLGQMHYHFDGIEVNRRRMDSVYLVDRPLHYITEFYEGSPYLKRLEEAGNVIRTYLNDKEKNNAAIMGLCHGDTHNYNIRFEESQPILFDFDCAAYGLREYDLAVQRWNIAMFQLDEDKQEEQWDGLIDGYATIRDMKLIDLKHIPHLVAARNLWLMGLQLNCIHYNRGCDWVNDEWIKWNTEFIEKWIG